MGGGAVPPSSSGGEVMIEQGTVIARDDGQMRVRFQRRAACEGCNACRTLGNGDMTIELENRLGAVVGDTVEVRLPTGKVVQLFLITFGIPFLFFIIGIAVGWGLAPTVLPARLRELGAFAFGLLLTALGYGVVHLFDRHLGAHHGYTPVPLRVIKQGENDEGSSS